MANSADPGQLASEEAEANWSGSTLFAKAEYIRVQQDKGYMEKRRNIWLFNLCTITDSKKFKKWN